MNITLTMRPVRDDDEPFLKELRAEFDSERLHLNSWPAELEEQKKILLATQFDAHTLDRAKADWDKTSCIVEVGGKKAGQFTVFQNSEEIRIADIVISKAFRGMGVGQAIIEGTQGECVQSKRPLRLHVDMLSPALQFYQSLGFRLLEQRDTNYFMEWLPPNMQGQKLHFPSS